MKKNLLTILTLIILTSLPPLFAQEVVLVGDSTSMVNVRGDIRLGSATQLPGIKPVKTFLTDGYRIVLYRGDVKTEAQKIKSQFSKKYPKIESFILFNSPTYYVRVGNFKTEKEAEEFLSKIKSLWPNAVIIEDQIKVTL